jgi:hypothetical protein
MAVPWDDTVALLQYPITVCGTSNPQIHLRYARPRMNSSVTLTTNTQDDRRCHPKVNFSKASFRMGRVSFDAIWRICNVFILSSATPQ